MKKVETKVLTELIQFVRVHSPFYRELYSDLPPNETTLERLPLIPHARFWQANTYEGNQLLTGPIPDGIILKSGGTTGKPKFSVFTRDEWNEFTATFASKLGLTGLVDGDRVANLFYAGDLYGSFLFTHKVLEECPVRLVQLPIAGTTPMPNALKGILEYEATVIAGLPTTLLALTDEMGGKSEPRVHLILFAGEPMQEDQRARMRRIFPDALIRSIGYASNDSGLLGYTDESCAPNEFRGYDGEAIYEILDDTTGEPIHEAGRKESPR